MCCLLPRAIAGAFVSVYVSEPTEAQEGSSGSMLEKTTAAQSAGLGANAVGTGGTRQIAARGSAGKAKALAVRELENCEVLMMEEGLYFFKVYREVGGDDSDIDTSPAWIDDSHMFSVGRKHGQAQPQHART